MKRLRADENPTIPVVLADIPFFQVVFVTILAITMVKIRALAEMSRYLTLRKTEIPLPC